MSGFGSFVLPLAVAAGTAVVVLLLLHTRAARLVLDHPNERSLHTRPTPRIGGIAMFVALVPAFELLGLRGFALFAGALSLLSFLDDRFGLPVLVRFGAHALAAALFVSSLPDLHPFAAFCVALAMMWMTNLYNFMDGSDGLAGGMALIGFGCYALAAAVHGDTPLALAATCISCAAAAFLYFNFPPAKIFLGDAGSVPLGFLAAALGLWGWQRQVWPLWYPVLVFAPFIVDATLTLMRRAGKLERIWRAHRSHYYQRLIQSGWSHRRTAVAAYVLMLASGLVAIWLRTADPALYRYVLPLAALFYMVLAFLIDRAWSRREPDEIQ